MAKGKFWSNGLKFECRRCGNCCTFPGGTVYATEREFRRIAEFLDLPFEDFLREYTEVVDGYVSLISRPDGPCVLYEDGCSVYSHRPTQCSTFPFWEDVVRSSGRWKEEAVNCHGMNRGRLWRSDEIKQVLKQGDQNLMKGTGSG